MDAIACRISYSSRKKSSSTFFRDKVLALPSLSISTEAPLQGERHTTRALAHLLRCEVAHRQPAMRECMLGPWVDRSPRVTPHRIFKQQKRHLRQRTAGSAAFDVLRF